MFNCSPCSFGLFDVFCRCSSVHAKACRSGDYHAFESRLICVVVTNIAGGFGPGGGLDHSSMFAATGGAAGGLSLGGFGASGNDFGDLQVNSLRPRRQTVAGMVVGICLICLTCHCLAGCDTACTVTRLLALPHKVKLTQGPIADTPVGRTLSSAERRARTPACTAAT